MAARKSTFAVQKVWDKAKVFNQEPTLDAVAISNKSNSSFAFRWRKVTIVLHSDGNLSASIQSKKNWAWHRAKTDQRIHSKNHLSVSDNVFQSKADKVRQP